MFNKTVSGKTRDTKSCCPLSASLWYIPVHIILWAIEGDIAWTLSIALNCRRIRTLQRLVPVRVVFLELNEERYPDLILLHLMILVRLHCLWEFVIYK